MVELIPEFSDRFQFPPQPHSPILSRLLDSLLEKTSPTRPLIVEFFMTARGFCNQGGPHKW